MVKMDSETKVYFRQQIHPGPEITEEQDHVANDLSSFIVKKMEILHTNQLYNWKWRHEHAGYSFLKNS